MFRILTLSTAIALGFFTQYSAAGNDHAVMRIENDQRCIASNSTPDHSMGTFPNRGNPHSFRPQKVEVCVDAPPAQTGHTVTRTNASGVSLTGLLFRPSTAEYFDPSSHRGFSRNRSSGWRVEGMGAGDRLGLDDHHAHVDHRGLYHRHASSSVLIPHTGGSLIGYAADGFQIHYIGDGAQSSWRLKSGTRPDGPTGRYDGTYVEDWEYIAQSGNLDECNGATVNGTYVYFATDRYPFFPRCFKGSVSADFMGRP